MFDSVLNSISGSGLSARLGACGLFKWGPDSSARTPMHWGYDPPEELPQLLAFLCQNPSFILTAKS